MDEKIRRAQSAEAVLGNELFQDGIAHLKQEYFKAFGSAKTLDAREDAHRFLVLLDRFENHLKSAVISGELTKREQEALRGKKPLWR